MVIPIYEWPVCIDFIPFMDLLQKKYNFNMYDVAGKRSVEGCAEREAYRKEWLKENDYLDMDYALNKPEGSNEDWPRDSAEMAMRININDKLWPVMDNYDRNIGRPYQNLWHWLTAHAFKNFERGSVTNLYSYWNSEDSSAPEWAAKILNYIFEETKNHPANDGERIAFHIDW